MSSPVDVPGRSLPSHEVLSASPNEMSFIDCAMSGTFSSPNITFSNYNMVHMSDALNKPDCPFNLLAGEVLQEQADFAGSKVFLTNYRFIILYEPSRSPVKVESIAIGNIDAIDSSSNNDMLHILCKDARVIRVQTCSLEQTLVWYKKLTALAQPRPPPALFALTFTRAVNDVKKRAVDDEPDALKWIERDAQPEYVLNEEALFKRWGLDPDYFAVVDYNDDYNICASYPRTLIVPASMTKEEIQNLRDYRMLGRIPAVCWACPEKNVLLLRASQPRPALLNWRNDKDEKFLRLVTEYTSAKSGVENSGRIKIFDCRSYLATLGNRMKGGGSEREEHYQNMKLEYCNLPNIHNVRYTFDALRKLFNPPVEQSSFLASLQATNWLAVIMNILSYANKAAEQLEKGRNVLIHCSDGWDRTTQLVTLVKILVDPYYRTIAGLEEIIRRDWIGYGHKFSDRNGISGTDANERCPVFLQWLDALHQVHAKFPTHFEYSMAYLVKLAAHHSSGLFTSFCFNTVKEMEEVLESEKCAPLPIWRMLNSDKCYENALYQRGEPPARLHAPENMQALRLWNEVYRCQDVASLLKAATHDNDEGGGSKKAAAGAAAAAAAAAGAAETPAAEPRRTPAHSPEMERSMVKSRSQDSLASTSESQTIAAGPPLRATESDEEGDIRERRNTRTSSGSLEATVAAVVALAVSGGAAAGSQLHQSPQQLQQHHPAAANGCSPSAAAAAAAAAADVAPLLDHDGLVRFVDPAQESARKKFAELTESGRKREETERQRMRSEMSDISIGRGDDEPFQMDDLMSDASVVDEHELIYTPKHVGTQVHATHCSVCRHAFNIMNSKLNCNSCGRAVCSRCSGHSYMETCDGVARPRKACSECYSKMHSTPTPLTPSSSSSSSTSASRHSAHSARSCPDGEAACPKGAYVSPSQAVKG